MNKERKADIAEEILRWIKSEDFDEEQIEADSENEYSLYAGTIGYLIDFRSAYKGFTKDLIDFIKEKFKIKDIKLKSVEKQQIILIIEQTETKICREDYWLTVKYMEV